MVSCCRRFAALCSSGNAVCGLTPAAMCCRRFAAILTVDNAVCGLTSRVAATASAIAKSAVAASRLCVLRGMQPAGLRPQLCAAAASRLFGLLAMRSAAAASRL